MASTKTGNPLYVEPSVLVLYRADQSFALNDVIPDPGRFDLGYDLVIASQPYRSRLPAETKVRNVLAPLARSLAPGGVTRAAAFGRGTIPVVYAPPPLLELYPDTESNDLDGSILPAWVRMRSLADLLLLCRSSKATFAAFAAASDGRERADDDSDDRCLDPSTDGSLGWTPRSTGDGAGDGPGDTSAAPTRGGLRLGGIVDPSAKRWGAS